MPIKLCSVSTCRAETEHRGRCAEHSAEYRREHHSPHRWVYDSKRWSVLRARKLFIQPLCERCGVIATDVHHVVDLSEGGEPFAAGNLESLCARCHGRHTAARRQ